MKRTWNSIQDADISKIRVRSKKEIIDKITEIEQEYEKEQKKKNEYHGRGEFGLESMCDTYMRILQDKCQLLDWVLHINN